MWQRVWERLQEFIQHREFVAMGIIFGSILTAFIVEIIIRRTIVALAAKTETDLDDKIAEALRRPIFVSVILIGLSWAVHTVDFGVKPTFLTNAVLKSVAVWVWSSAGFRIGHAFLETFGRRAKEGSVIQERTIPVFDILIKLIVVGAAIYFTFLAWEIDVTAWLASAGIVGIAVGFAAKDTLANLFAGIFILADGPYKVGDFIVLDGGMRGEVIKIGMRSTRMLTLDEVEVTVPNSVIGNSSVVNEMGGPDPTQRIAIPVGVAYGSDIDQVRSVILACAKDIEYVCDTPLARVRFITFGASSLDFELLVFIEQARMRDVVIDAINCNIYKAFAREDIEIPYSKHDVYIKGMVKMS